MTVREVNDGLVVGKLSRVMFSVICLGYCSDSVEDD